MSLSEIIGRTAKHKVEKTPVYADTMVKEGYVLGSMALLIKSGVGALGKRESYARPAFDQV
jgi:hypothetical protein